MFGDPIEITTSAIRSKIVIVAEIKRYKSVIKKKKKKHDKIVLLTKSKINGIEVLISKGLINSNINFKDSNIWNERRNQKFKDLNTLSKVLVKL